MTKRDVLTLHLSDHQPSVALQRRVPPASAALTDPPTGVERNETYVSMSSRSGLKYLLPKYAYVKVKGTREMDAVHNLVGHGHGTDRPATAT